MRACVETEKPMKKQTACMPWERKKKEGLKAASLLRRPGCFASLWALPTNKRKDTS